VKKGDAKSFCNSGSRMMNGTTAMEMREMLSPAAGKEAEALPGGGGSDAEAVSAETGGERRG
jgi:hypothetical protein